MTPALIPFLKRARPGRAAPLLQRRPVAREILSAASFGARIFRAGATELLSRPLAGHAAPSGTSSDPGRGDRPPNRPAPTGITALVYELLDAHDDTAQMAAGLACDPEWSGHLEYLRALQRKGRETLAQTCAKAAE